MSWSDVGVRHLCLCESGNNFYIGAGALVSAHFNTTVLLSVFIGIYRYLSISVFIGIIGDDGHPPVGQFLGKIQLN